MSTITDTTKQSRAPALNVDNFMLYQVVMKSWLKRFQGADEALSEEPVKKTLDAADIAPTLNPRGAETEATAVLRKSHEESYRTWTNRNNMAYSALVESCSSNDEAMVLVMETNSANAKDLWTAIVNKFNKQYLSIKQQAIADFNSLFIRPNESLPDFIIRIKQSRLRLLNMGVQINEDMDLMGRLKSGISIDHRFENVVTNLSFNDYTWEQAIQKIDSIKNLSGNKSTQSTDQTTDSIKPKFNETANYSGDKPNSSNKSNQFNNKKEKNGKSNINNNDNKKQFDGNCRFCVRYGHKERDCRVKCRVIGLSKKSYPNQNVQNGSNETRDGKGKRKICHVCGSSDHWTSDCRFVKEAKASANKSGGSGTNDRHDKDHYEFGLMMREYETRSKNSNSNEGIMDSGSSSHMLRRSVVGGANIREEPIMIGTAKSGAVLTGEGRANVGKLEESIVVDDEDLSMNLVSVGKLDMKGYTILFRDGGCKVIDETNNTVMARGILRNGQYCVDLRDFADKETSLLASVAPPESDQLWHERLGHVHHRKICHAASKELIKGIHKSLKNKSKHSPLCSGCATAKSTKRFVRSKKANERKSTPTYSNSDSNDEYDIVNKSVDYSDSNSEEEEYDEPGTILPDKPPSRPLQKVIRCISTDLKGPLRIAGRGGEHYYQGFIDNDTKFLYSYGMATKDMALQNLGDLIDIQLRSKGETLLRYHSDGAPELISSKIVQFLAARGCTVTYSPAYEPRGNAIKERNHRTLFESAHAMLNASALNTSFWFYAIEYATAIFNCIPTNTKSGYMTPYQAKFGEVPSVKIFKKFGCLCFVHIPDVLREKGLVDKSYRAYFIGLDLVSLSYKVYIIELDQVRSSAHVVFDEVTVLQRAAPVELTIDPESKTPKDFYYLVGMVYIDNEDGMKYVTTRVVTEKKMIVAYRAPYSHDGIAGSEEHRPVHVADAALLVAQYQSEHQPVVLDGGNHLPVVGVRNIDDPVVSRPPLRSSGGAAKAHGETGNFRVKPVGADEGTINDGIAPNTPNLNTLGSGDTSAAPVQLGTGPDQLTRRVPSLRNRPRTVINVGTLGDVSHVANIVYDSHEYVYFMTNFNSADEHAFNAAPQEQTVFSPNYDNWLEAQLDELKSIVVEHCCWEPEPLPLGTPSITLKWVHTIKNNGKRKSRLVARGFTQERGVNYFETSSPTAKMASIRILLSLIGILDMDADLLDIKTAFLYAKLDETLYAKPPSDLDKLYTELIPLCNWQQRHHLQHQLKLLREGSYLRLRKSLYGTKQASRNWYNTLNEFIISKGFTRNRADLCLYTRINDSNITFLLVYVDDIIIASTDNMIMQGVISELAQRFQITRKGGLTQFLNIDLHRNRESKQVAMSQAKYIEQVYHKFATELNLQNKAFKTPMTENFQIILTEEEMTAGVGKNSSDSYIKNFPYQELLGSLLFLTVCTRPDLSYPISYLAKFAGKYNQKAIDGLLRVLYYVNNTKFYLLRLGGAAIPRLVGYCDSDFAGCPITRKSTSGSIVFIALGPVIWYSKMQTIVAQSTAEAEYLAMYPICQNIIWIRNMFYDFNFARLKPVFSSTIWVDNQAAIEISKSNVLNTRMKHIALKLSLIKELFNLGIITPDYVDTADNRADIFTKAVSSRVFERLCCTVLGLESIVPYSLKRIKTVENEDYF